MKIFLAVVLFMAASAFALPTLQDVETEWSLFKTKYGKVYKSLIEENQRKAIFTDNYNLIKERNHQYESGLITYTLKINKFADTTSNERKFLKGFKSSKNQFNFEKYQSSSVAAPNSFDWTQKGAVTRVKNQGNCGSCWAFSTTGSLEGQYFLRTGQLVEISEQNLVDCSKANVGCDGGDMGPAFDYIRDNGGIDSEASYPYRGADGQCQYNSGNSVTTVTGYVMLDVGNEDQLKEAVANIGPISVAMDASSEEFDFYSNGIFAPQGCSTVDLDHAVLAVGYGSENGQDYWLVKNSWSADWGLSGYIKMIRNDNNHCGIATESIYPLL